MHHGGHNDRAVVPAASPPLAPLISHDIVPSTVIATASLSPALRDIHTTTELVDALNVPAPALRRLLALCRGENRSYYVLCSQRWFPRKFDN